MRIMGLDFGSKTVGVAVTDPLGITAQGITIVRRDSEKRLRKTYQEIERLAAEYEVNKFVIGLPMNMDGSCGERVEKTKAFAEDLKRRTGIDVEFWDERLTTVEAHEIMSEIGIKGDKRKDYVDEIAAVLILEDYMKSNPIEK